MLSTMKPTRLGLLAAVFTAAFAGSAAAQIKIGVIQPLTGPVAASGNFVIERREDRRRRDQRQRRRARARRSSS